MATETKPEALRPNAPMLTAKDASASFFSDWFRMHEYTEGGIVLRGGEEVHGATGIADATAAADATDLPTSITLVADLFAKLNTHFGNTTGGIHANADAVNTMAVTVPVTEEDVIAAANVLRGGYVGHIETADIWHVSADGQEVIALAAASTFVEAQALLNQIKEQYDDHIVVLLATRAGDLFLQASNDPRIGGSDEAFAQYDDVPLVGAASFTVVASTAFTDAWGLHGFGWNWVRIRFASTGGTVGAFEAWLSRKAPGLT